MTAGVERVLVVASGPGIVARAKADHSRLNPVTNLARRPDLQVRVNSKIDIAEQIFAWISGGVIVLFQRDKARARSVHRGHLSTRKDHSQICDLFPAIELLRDDYLSFGGSRHGRRV